MIKPLAILKDSLREAWDSKILLVLIILSTLFALVLASVGYQPIPAEELFGDIKTDMRKVLLNQGKFPGEFGYANQVQYDIEDFRELEHATNPANGRYSFHLKVSLNDEEAIPQPGFGPRPQKKKNIEKDKEKKDAPKGDVNDRNPFLELVIAWQVDANDILRKLKESRNLTEEQAKELMKFEVTDQMLEAFIRERIEFHYNVKLKSVTRKPAPINGPQEFDVVTDKSDPRNWPATPSLFFGSVSMSFLRSSLGRIIFNIEDVLVNGIGAAIALALGIIVTAFFLPNMLRKGSVDLMLAKPINRVALLLYKYLGGMSFMLIIATISVGMVWVVIGLRSGIWNPKFLVVIPVLTFTFGLLYAVSTLMAVLTRSAIASLLVTLTVSGVLWGIGAAYSKLDQLRNTPVREVLPDWVYTTGDTLNTLLPRTRDLDIITTKLIADTMSDAEQHKSGVALLSYPSFGSTLAVSSIWIALLLGIACWRFAKKDY